MKLQRFAESLPAPRLRRVARRGGSCLALRWACCTAPWLALLAAAGAGAATFVQGQLYLVSNALPTVNAGVLRIDPGTGATSLVLDLPNSPPVANTCTWDPYRRLVVFATSGASGALQGVDADGVLTNLAPGSPAPDQVASRGDGKLYLWFSMPEGFRWMDDAGVVHDLLDAGGVARFGLGAGKYITQLVYHPATNSLIGIAGNFAVANSPCGDPNQVCVVRIPLDVAGTRVAGAVLTTAFDVSTSFEQAVGVGRLPGGDLLLVVDTNSNNEEPRMTRFDPATMTLAPFARNGPYVGAAASNAGTFSHVLGNAVILDTSRDSLRAFAEGGRGDGLRICGGVSGGGTNEIAQLVEIDDSGVAFVGAPARPEGGSPVVWASAGPNPFRDRLTLRFAAAATAAVRLEIHDIAGRRVRSFEPLRARAGVQSMEWDGRDAAGASVRPGLYVATLTAGGARWRQAIVRVR